MRIMPKCLCLSGLCWCLLGSVGCESRNENKMKPQERTTYYLELDAAKQAKLRVALDDIKMGDNYQGVIAALGKPDYERNLATKDGRFVAKSAIYYIKKWEKELVSEGKDERVDLWFDANDRLWRVYSNVPGIPNRESRPQ